MSRSCTRLQVVTACIFIYVLFQNVAALRSERITRHKPVKSKVARVERSFDGPTRMVLNIGSNNDPPMPFNDTMVVAVEPLREVAANIEYVPDRMVLTAAVSDHYGVALFNHYDVSSSLLQPHDKNAGWKVNGRHGEPVMVPVVPLTAILDSLENFDCALIKTDMQGMDFFAVRGAANAVTRCEYIYAETYCNGFTNYANAQNDFDKDWMPHMKRLGFEALSFCGDWYGETNILWRNTKFSGSHPIPSALCPRCYGETVTCDNPKCFPSAPKGTCNCKIRGAPW
jgi:FkbM family methyltransferase